MESPRINQYLVSVGLAPSRRKADTLIKQGKVTINGEVSIDLAYRVGSTDTVQIDGQAGSKRTDIYIVYNKPTGQICSHSHQGNNPTIFETLPKDFSTLKIAGRLDKDSHGLVVLSSNGEFINQLTHPSRSKTKGYVVTTKQPIGLKSLDSINTGIKLEDGMSKLRARKIKSNTLRIEMYEGRKRQIRRTLAAVELDVTDLERVLIGKYSNPYLKEGTFEFVKPEDIL